MIWMALLLWPGALQGQFLPQLQARTPQEFDAYLDVMEAAPTAREEEARAFLAAYPESDMRLPVWELVARASRARGEVAAARRAAMEGLRLAPEYIPLLTLLAGVEANTMAAPTAKAAQEALRLLDQARAPRTLEAGEWREAVAHLRAENLTTLGIVAFKGGRVVEAVARLEESLQWEAAAATQYRLALLYLEGKRRVEARALLEKVMRSGDEALAERAREVLAQMK